MQYTQKLQAKLLIFAFYFVHTILIRRYTMDLGDMKSRDVGNLTSKALVNMGKDMLASGGSVGQVNSVADQTAPTDQPQSQNTGPNAKKEALGPNTKQKR